MSAPRIFRLVLSLLLLAWVQLHAQAPPPPSAATFQALQVKGEALLQSMPPECKTPEDWALVKALRHEWTALGGHVGALPKDWAWDLIEEAIQKPGNPEKRSIAAAAGLIASSTPQWETRTDPRGNMVFFQASSVLVDSEWWNGVRIPLAGMEGREFLKRLRVFCEEVESFRSAFAKKFQELSRVEAEKASARSNAFIQKVFNRQFPWEAWLNTHWAPGTLREPPQHQFILGHLHGGLVVATQGKTTTTPTVLLEVFGWERLTPTFDASWGFSAAYVPRLRPEEKDGGGLLIHYKTQSFGVVWKGEPGQGRTAHLVYTLALGQWLAGAK